MVKRGDLMFDRKLYNQIWRRNNRERCRENERKYRNRNRTAIRLRARDHSKRYRERNRERVLEYGRNYMRKYRIKNGELVKQQRRAYYEKHKKNILEKAHAYYLDNKVAKLAYANTYRENNRELINKKERVKSKKKVRYNYIRSLKLKYGLTIEEYTRLSRLQNNQCKICAKRVARLFVDHKEKGTFRGLLCNTCNVGIGMFSDSIANLRSAIRYLQDANKRKRSRDAD